MSVCRHKNFDVVALIDRIEDTAPMSFSLDVRVACRDCGQTFEFVGVEQVGISPRQPTISLDRMQLRLPLRPVGQVELPDYPGFCMRPAHA